MIARDLDDGRTILIRQEDHAELSGQFASHWGNGDFSRLDPWNSMVWATACHDSHFRDVEALLPIDTTAGRPHGHRTTPFWPPHVDALQEHIAWLDRRDRYAALLVSMHHSGLPQNRYGVIKFQRSGEASASPRPTRPRRPGADEMIERMEASQRGWISEFGRSDDLAEKRIWFNFRLLEAFDLLSLYLCCDGYRHGSLGEARIGPIPVSFESGREVDVRLLPAGGGSLRLDPYPFDLRPLNVSVPARIVRRLEGRSEAECRTEFWHAPCESLSWMLTD